MVDTLSKAARSERMGRIRSKDTKAELLVRRPAAGRRAGKTILPGWSDTIREGGATPVAWSIGWYRGC
jgi:G:T-mismatch repair DNA endonuclease (very short patch repair protein)